MSFFIRVCVCDVPVDLYVRARVHYFFLFARTSYMCMCESDYFFHAGCANV